MQASEDCRWLGESVVCRPSDVLKDVARSLSWKSDEASLNGREYERPAIVGSSQCKTCQSSAIKLETSSSTSDRQQARTLLGSLFSPHRSDSLDRKEGNQFSRIAQSLKSDFRLVSSGESRRAVDSPNVSLSPLATSNDVTKQGGDNVFVESYSSRQWKFEVIASLRAKPCSLASDVIAAVDFDEQGLRFASGGIARKIRVCSYRSLVEPQTAEEEDDFQEERETGPHGLRRKSGKRKAAEVEGVQVLNHDQAALRVISTPAKLSSLKWRPLSPNIIGCGDYDGVVTEWDVEQGLCLSERYDHSGQRIWSVDYSSWFPVLCASASGDGTVRIWTLNSDKCVGMIRSPRGNSICCAELSSTGPNRIAVACADSNVYLYDLRRLDSSLLCLQDHDRAASYVRFLSESELVSASIDSTVKLWDVSNPGGATLARNCTAGARGRLVRTFSSHKNVRNFVGLSVLKREGLVACGSESNDVWVYHKLEKRPVWKMEFPPAIARGRYSSHGLFKSKPHDDEEDDEQGKAFVGVVCWREHGDHHSLIAANSEGTVQVVRLSHHYKL